MEKKDFDKKLRNDYLDLKEYMIPILHHRKKKSKDKNGKFLVNLPELNIEFLTVKFSKEEKLIYDKYEDVAAEWYER